MQYKGFIYTASAALLLMMLTANAQAQTIQSPATKVNLLEVYTSQGCSSCPPAERWLTGFESDSRLWKQFIPINFHVDYWDYLGWKDPFSDARFSVRQRLYRKLGHARTVATPGFILNGRGWNGWFYQQRMPLVDSDTPGVITAEVGEKTVNVKYDSSGLLDRNVMINVAILGFDIITDVKRGENRGKALVHDFVVLGQQSVTMQMSGTRGSVNAELPDVSGFTINKQAVVIWVSGLGDPSPIQAAGGWL